MNAISSWTMALALLSGTVYGQVPSGNDTSDDQGNTGVGSYALSGPNYPLGAGSFNSALGDGALFYNYSGAGNTASGFEALYYNISGSYNTAVGYGALVVNDTGNTGVSGNTANGAFALQNNSTGQLNTAVGYYAMNESVTGSSNTAVGYQALLGSAPTYGTASNNTAVGAGALYSFSSGGNNTASGYNALYSNTTGSNNIAIGYEAGYKVITGSNNIEIGNVGAAGDNKEIKIGTEGAQKKAFIAGIYGNSTVSGLAVVIGSNGELGAVSSSERFKTGIAAMGSNTEKLQLLRPVTFHYKSDARGTLRYGLIAEEVAKVYPELVVRDQKGRIDGVRYDELAPMLLNELQKQDARIRGLEQEVAKVNDLERALTKMHAALTALQSSNPLAAQR